MKKRHGLYESELTNCVILRFIAELYRLKEPSSSSVNNWELMLLLLHLLLKDIFTHYSGIILNSRLHLLFPILLWNN